MVVNLIHLGFSNLVGERVLIDCDGDFINAAVNDILGHDTTRCMDLLWG